MINIHTTTTTTTTLGTFPRKVPLLSTFMAPLATTTSTTTLGALPGKVPFFTTFSAACRDRNMYQLQWLGRGFCQMGHFQLFWMILKFSMGHFLSFYTNFYGPFSKLMGLWRMAPCLPNHCNYLLTAHSNDIYYKKLLVSHSYYIYCNQLLVPNSKNIYYKQLLVPHSNNINYIPSFSSTF